MKITGKSAAGHLILFAFVMQYLFLSICVDLCHDHEADFAFHDDCLACQWQNLYQEDHSQAGHILAALDDPLFVIGYEWYIDLLILPSEVHVFPHSPRAPPNTL